MLLHTPARGEDDKISNGHTWLGAGTGQHCEDGGILCVCGWVVGEGGEERERDDS